MATHDYVLDNATGANFRSDLNNALAAIVSNNSSSSEPSTKYAYQWWADTNEGVLKIRNSANDGWVTLLQLDGTLTLEDGSASAPALGFRDDLNTGIFSSAADNLDITTGGTTRVNVSSTGINVTGTVVDDGATHDGDVTFTGASANIVFDKSDNQLEFADNAKAEFGTGGDLEIYHDGTDNHIVSTNGQINIQTNSTENSIQCIPNGAVKLFHDNNLQVITSSTGIDFADNKKANFGGEDDLQIYHDGSNSYIDDSGTGNLLIRGNNIELHKYTGEDYAKFIANGEVELYYDNSKKFETYTSGVRAANNGHIKLASDSGKFFMGAGDDAELFHDGTNLTLNGDGTNDTFLRAKSGENSIKLVPDGGVELYFNNGRKLRTVSGGVRTDANIEMLDSHELQFGDGVDFKIYHDGVNSIQFFDSQVGAVRFRTDIGNSARTALQLSAGVDLYYDNSKKFETTSAGVTITGTCTATAFSGDGSGLTGVGGAVGGNTGVDFNDSVKIRLGTGNDFEIYHNGTDGILDNNTGNLSIQTTANLELIIQSILQVKTKGGTENCIIGTTDGSVELYNDNSKKFETTSSGAKVNGNLVINDGNQIQLQNSVANRTSEIVNGGSNTNSDIQFRTNGTHRATVAKEGHFEPALDNTYDLGVSNLRWRNIYTNDLNLSNEGSSNDVDGTWGSYTIQEGEESLFLINKRNGKKFKFLLEAVS